MPLHFNSRRKKEFWPLPFSNYKSLKKVDNKIGQFIEAGKWDKNKNICWDFVTFNEKFFLFVQNYLLEPALQRDMIDCSTSVSETSKGCLGLLCSNLQSHLYAKNSFGFSHFQVTPLKHFLPKKKWSGVWFGTFFWELEPK